jgi:hypothetical protein
MTSNRYLLSERAMLPHGEGNDHQKFEIGGGDMG